MDTAQYVGVDVPSEYTDMRITFYTHHNEMDALHYVFVDEQSDFDAISKTSYRHHT
jgi:hypothetical protein